ncbi:hypothetical protein [Endozoicomonas sp. ALB032]|uniref:hypothetical protein n=2 Tax=unclassified Endozoicomonas TaxID=2644528 RepID=UPI003BB62307
MALLLSLSVICQAGSLTRRLIVELERDADSPKQNFSIKRDWRTLSGNPPDVALINDYSEPDLPPVKKRHSLYGYVIEKTIIESISWQWLYASNLLIAYELFVTTKVAPMSAALYLWLSLEVSVAVAWLLKNYWRRDIRLFSPIEQQAASIMLTRWEYRFATITAVFGSGENSLQYQSSESSSQQAPKATLTLISSFINPLNDDYSGGNGGDQQHLHTLGLNCFIHPCYGFCQLQPLSFGKPAEWPLNTLKSSCVHLATGHCPGCMKHFDPAYVEESCQNPFFNTLHDLSDIHLPFEFEPTFEGIDDHLTGLVQNTIDANGLLNDDVPAPGHLSSSADDFAIINRSLDLQRLPKEDEPAFKLKHSETQQTTSKSSRLDQSLPHLSRTDAAQAKADSAQKTCEVIVSGKDGQQRPCGKVFKSVRALGNHKSKCHTGQKVCGLSVVGKDGEQRPCGMVFKNVGSLENHKSRYHTGQKTCDLTVVGEDGQQRPCEKVYKNARALWSHKSKCHTGQKVCDLIEVRKDGQQRPCGMVFKNAGSLENHKSRYHTGQKTCDLTVVGEDGQQRPCGMVNKNAGALANHKIKCHTGQKVCDLTKVAKDGQQRPCGKLCQNAKALADHKGKYHRGQKACAMIVVGEDGQRRQCGKPFMNANSLLYHKRREHSGQRTCEVIVFGEDGQQLSSGTACKKPQTLSYNKRRDRKRKPALGEDDELSPPGGKVNKRDYQGKMTD